MDDTTLDIASEPVQTVAGLFDDRIDAEHALGALRKASAGAGSVSVLAKDRAADQNGDRPVDVTRAVMDTALSAVGTWLSGLAALMVPNRGNFLAAGPIGVALAGELPRDQASDRADSRPAAPVPEPIEVSLASAIERFGFRPEEAHYIEERLSAGSAMIAVTAGEQPRIDHALQTFAEFNAVFIGQAETPAEVMVEAERWLAAPLTTKTSELVVADVVTALGHVCGVPDADPSLRGWCGLRAVDEQGERLGDVDDLLADPTDPALLRYVVIGHGGVLGVARRRIAVPAAAVVGGEEVVRVLVGRERLSEAPAYHPGEPFSRKDEQAIHAFFETTPYWGA